MSEVAAEKAQAAEEARRRLRLSRLVSELTTLQAQVFAAGAADDVDVVVHLSGSDPESTESVRRLLAGLRVRVVEGRWVRS